ncbi:MAG: hypothetical protein OEN21_17590 [Myxococcales bacterium]|nr:hypothetical protein [Myxococcales bacterium]
MNRDQARLRNGFLEILTGDGWRVALSPDQIESVRGRNEGGCCIHLRHGRPILLDVPVKRVLAELEGTADATS